MEAVETREPASHSDQITQAENSYPLNLLNEWVNKLSEGKYKTEQHRKAQLIIIHSALSRLLMKIKALNNPRVWDED